MTSTVDHERRMGDWMRRHAPAAIVELIMFTLKQGWACLFAGCLLAALIVSHLIWQADWPIARYDALFLVAVTLQAVFLRFKLETWAEARVILLFHITGTAMEWFKVSAGSWSYPEAGIFVVFGVPLFSGFMYAAVGSYMARVIRLFDMQFAPFPRFGLHIGLAVAVYVNFFSHHFIWDMRYGLFAATVLIYARTRIWFRIGANWYWMPLPLAAFLCSIFLWIAENVGTLTGTWIYSGQGSYDLVSLSKLGSWYLLLYVSFATVTLIIRDALRQSPFAPARKAPPQKQPAQPVQSKPLC